MAELHEALKTLSPIDFDSELDQSALPTFLTSTFTDAELLCNSVPLPAGGTPFADAKPSCTEPNTARSHSDMTVSEARPPALDSAHEALQKQWGKPYKFGAKENPLNLSLYKMAGKDRHGAWFARRSVHEGMGFDKFRRAIQREFPESLAFEGGPGEGAIRGLACDRRLERLEVEGGKGKVEVYQLSAQFPGPTTPREFMTLLMTSDNALTGKSEMRQGEGAGRHFMIVSKPVKHHDAPERGGMIKGQYESVEMIREVPLSKENPELNPVEWIMITRSDPGGGIPRFMVDRGTPSAMIGDVHKFLDWAAAMETVPDADADVDKQMETSQKTVETSAPAPETGEPTAGPPVAAAAAAPPPAQTNGHAATAKQGPPVEPSSQAGGGVVANLTNAVEAGIHSYAPTAISSYLPNNGIEGAAGGGSKETPGDYSSSSSDSDATSVNSFASATEMRTNSTMGDASKEELGNVSSNNSLGVTSTGSPEAHKPAIENEKSMQKIQKQQAKLDEKLAKKREAEEAKLQSSKEKEESEQIKAKEKYEKEVKKTEEKHQKELQKLEAKKQKEAEKAAKKRSKNADRDSLGRVSRERDDFREQVDLLRRENELVRKQLGEAQRENTMLASRLGKLGGPGAEVLRSVKSELEAEGGGRRSRSGSMRSHRS